MNRDVLDFVTFCVGVVSRKLHLSRKDTYNRLESSGILSGYIVKCYDVLHTFSSDYIADDIIEYMKEKGVVV